MNKFTTDREVATHVVIITALAKELDAVLAHLPGAQRISTKGRIAYKATLGRYNVVVLSLVGMGNVSAAVATTQAIDVWNPQVVIVTGISGGIEKGDERLLGDVIVAEQIVGYEQAKLTSDDVSRRYDVLRSSMELRSVAEAVARTAWFAEVKENRPDGTSNRVIPQVHFGVIASGEKVVAGGDIPITLKKVWPQLVGIEMEGYGAALATYQASSAPKLLLIKAICDFVDSRKNDLWQRYAADVAATFVKALLKFEPFEPENRRQAERLHPPKYRHRSKIFLCRDLGPDWRDLADYFEIPLHTRDQFDRGYECQSIWDWLVRRRKLGGLPDGLVYIKREDLLEHLIEQDGELD